MANLSQEAPGHARQGLSEAVPVRRTDFLQQADSTDKGCLDSPPDPACSDNNIAAVIGKSALFMPTKASPFQVFQHVGKGCLEAHLLHMVRKHHQHEVA